LFLFIKIIEFNRFQKKEKKKEKRKEPWQPDSSGYFPSPQVLSQDDPWSKNDPWQLKQWFAFSEHVLHDGLQALLKETKWNERKKQVKYEILLNLYAKERW